MRDIKFRVWNGSNMEQNVMIGLGVALYVDVDHNGEICDPDDSASLSPCNTFFDKDTPVMQFTGLKDRDGVEIYEGDILSDIESEWESHLGIVSYDDTQAKFIVLDWRGENTGDVEEWSECPIVGNVYQTPELMKANGN